jgi:uncharacterized repeat protein (TIGR01451 family)
MAAALFGTLVVVLLGSVGGASAAPGPTDLSLTKSDTADPVTVGDTFSYNIQVQNPGTNDATDVVVTDTLPTQVDHLSTTTNPTGAGVSCQRQGVTVTCSFGTLLAGAAAHVTIRVKADDDGTATNAASVTTTVVDTDTTNNQDLETTLINKKPTTTKKKKTKGKKKGKKRKTQSCASPTISGTSGNDPNIVGTPGPDVIRGFAGDDVIFAGGGNDLICADFGADFVNGGPGGDTVIGGLGADRLIGARGSDFIRGKGGPDRLRGRRGPDFLNGGRGRDSCRGGPGRDTFAHCP